MVGVGAQGVTIVKNQDALRTCVSNGGRIPAELGGAGTGLRSETVSLACPLVVGGAGGAGARRKMQGGSSGSTPASGLGSAVAKCEVTTEKDGQGRERKSGLLAGIKIDQAPIKTNSSSKRKFHGWSTVGEPFLKKCVNPPPAVACSRLSIYTNNEWTP